MKRFIQLFVPIVFLFVATANAEPSHQSTIDPVIELNPTLYESLTDVPEKYHDGKKLIDCYISDKIVGKSENNSNDIYCHNPFYLDEYGNLRHIYDFYLPFTEPFPPTRSPDTYKPAPCEGCLNERQAIDIARVYHDELSLKPLGYRATIVKDFPWNGQTAINLDCMTDTPFPDLSPYDKVNLHRRFRPFTGDRQLLDQCRDLESRDLTWMIQFQVGWLEKDYRGELPHSIPCVAAHYIHAETGWIISSSKTFYFGNPHSDMIGGISNPSRHHIRYAPECTKGTETDGYHNLLHPVDYSLLERYDALLEAYQQLFLYLPNSPRRKQLESHIQDIKRFLNEIPPVEERP